MKLFNPGDQVRLTGDIGAIKAGSLGLIVEVYGESPLGPDEETMDTLFDYAVIFPEEVNKLMTHQGAWIRTDIRYDQFHAGDAIPVSEDELELYVEGVEPKAYGLIPRDVLAARWDANTGHEGAKALAAWVGGRFDYDSNAGQENKTYYWSIMVSHHSGYLLRAKPGQYILKYSNGDIRSMNPDTFISTYEALEK